MKDLNREESLRRLIEARPKKRGLWPEFDELIEAIKSGKTDAEVIELGRMLWLGSFLVEQKSLEQEQTEHVDAIIDEMKMSDKGGWLSDRVFYDETTPIYTPKGIEV